MNFIKSLIVAAVVATATFTMTGCAALEEFFGGQDMVLTTSDQVVESERAEVVPATAVPDELEAELPDGATLVLTDRENVVPGGKAVSIADPAGEGSFETLIDVALSTAGAFIPGLAAWEGVLALLFRRKRSHYMNAAKSLVPYDKNIDLGGAVTSILAGLGVSHSTPETEAVFEGKAAAIEVEEDQILEG